MLYTHKELEKLLTSDYQIKIALAEGKIFKIERGIYSKTPYVHPLEVVVKKYPHAIFTMNSAFYYHGLTDVIPQKMYLAVKRTTTRRVSNSDIIYTYVQDKYLDLGKSQIEYEGVLITIYNKERMLIELVRNKRSMPFDYYKEIVASYRKITDKLDTQNLEEYAAKFGIEDYIFKSIHEEVF